MTIQKFLFFSSFFIFSILELIQIFFSYDSKPLLITSLCLISSFTYFIPSYFLQLKKKDFKPAFLFIQTLPIRFILILSIVLVLIATKYFDSNLWLIFFIFSYFSILFFEVIYILKYQGLIQYEKI